MRLCSSGPERAHQLVQRWPGEHDASCPDVRRTVGHGPRGGGPHPSPSHNASHMALVPGLCPDGQGEPVGLVGRELGPATLKYFDRFSKRDVSKRVGTSSARTGAVGRLAGGILSNPGGFNRRWSPEVKQAALDLAADIGTEAA